MNDLSPCFLRAQIKVRLQSQRDSMASQLAAGEAKVVTLRKQLLVRSQIGWIDG